MWSMYIKVWRGEIDVVAIRAVHWCYCMGRWVVLVHGGFGMGGGIGGLRLVQLKASFLGLFRANFW